MTARLAGKHCLITAAGAGIGRESALAFARSGATVLATDIDAAALASLAAEHEGIHTQHLDVSDSTQIDALISSCKPLDVLFNCAGFVPSGTLLDTDYSTWRRTFTLNVDSMYHLCRAVLPSMLKRGHGNIINMASVASSIKGVPNRCAYSASKAAVIGLSKAIATDYVSMGVRCNAICPGTVDTPSLAHRIAAMGANPAAALRSFIERQPMGRLGTPAEVAALAVYLASDESSFTTGTVHVIDGGWST